MEFPENLKYTMEHEWVRVEGENATVGITEYAQNGLGDIVFVEMPKIGLSLTRNNTFGSIHSNKTVSDLYAPVSGTVITVNTVLETTPDQVNKDPYGNGWMFILKIANPSEIDALLDARQYRSLIGQ